MKTTTKRMPKLAAYEACRSFGGDASYLANVILVRHGNAAKKLNGLLRLLQAGIECRTGQFAIDVLIVDGERRDWATLES